MTCDHCPCPADVACLGPTSHPHFCRWAKGDVPGQHRLIVARSRSPYTAPGPMAMPPDRPTVRSQHAANRTLLSCLYRDHHCGCSLPTCHARLGDHDDGAKSSREHCLACLKSTWHLTETRP